MNDKILISKMKIAYSRGEYRRGLSVNVKVLCVRVCVFPSSLTHCLYSSLSPFLCFEPLSLATVSVPVLFSAK